MSGKSQRAVQDYRRRLTERGLRRYEVLGLPEDQDLIRRLAKQLSDGSSASTRLRGELERLSGGGPMSKGNILEMLRRSPLADAELDVTREVVYGRPVDL